MKEVKDVKPDIAKKLEGLNTISTISRKLGVKKKTAINYVYELRKAGLVKTTRGKDKVRVYDIFPIKRADTGYLGLYDIINKYSPVRVSKPYEHRVYEKMSIEEAIVRALETKDFRTILASIALFRHVKDWSGLYWHAKNKGMRRQAGALYDLSRKVIRVRRMDKRIERMLLNAKQEDRSIVPAIRAKDFPEIEKKWRIYMPFRKGDLRRLKE